MAHCSPPQFLKDQTPRKKYKEGKQSPVVPQTTKLQPNCTSKNKASTVSATGRDCRTSMSLALGLTWPHLTSQQHLMHAQ